MFRPISLNKYIDLLKKLIKTNYIISDFYKVSFNNRRKQIASLSINLISNILNTISQTILNIKFSFS